MSLHTSVGESERLLSPLDPDPVTIINGESTFPVLLVCEHAGQIVPQALGDLSLNAEALDAHIGWDIGAAGVTRLLADRLGAPAVLQSYSRLVIDCNRPPEAPDSMPEMSDGVPVPGNRGLTPDQRAARKREIFDPFDAAVKKLRGLPHCQAILSIHSFNPQLSDGVKRPWEISFLYRKDTATSERLRQLVLENAPNLTIGMNEPYQIDDESDWFVPRHGEESGLPHSLIEIRNDLISDAAGQAEWAKLMTAVVHRFATEL
ncbi:N-formylglutamate amidohydrolase [Nitratireductor kimnyeongensis]|uniref:N-formylglutamate amidohydrolase n=1 Tax=Nitratireductor kimnyeongensis TaxID=430679 RepID=A0ABW0T591_9HYPH|nr:N-formylglutamate amidohydrolase [Nitratireductor kimnyeongensis]QZZ34474.1 N-formylglutamate amidohydrolase [Nitratireductor kimnyeongensis]